MDITPAIKKFLDISTAHITAEDGKRLESFQPSFGLLMLVEKMDFGTRVICAEDPSTVQAIDRLRKMGFSINFIRILQAAHKADCYYISFDPDGTVIPGLEVFEW